MTLLFFAFTAAGAIVFQTTFTQYFFDWTGGRPDVMLLVTLYIGVQRGTESGLATGFFLGLLQDILSGGLLGANALTKGLLGHLTGGLVRSIGRRNWFFIAALGFFTTVFDLVGWAMLSALFQPHIGLKAGFWVASLKTVVLNAILAPFAFHMLSPIEGRIVPSSLNVPYPDRF